MRGRDVDDVDLGVGDQGLVRRVRPGAELGRERLGRLLRPRAHGGDLGARHVAQVVGEVVGDAAGGEDPPAGRCPSWADSSGPSVRGLADSRRARHAGSE